MSNDYRVSPAMLPGAAGATPITVIAFWAAFAVWVASELWMQWRVRRPKSTGDRDKGSMVVLVVTVWGALALALAASIVESGAAIAHGRYLLYWLGVTLMLAGVVLRWSAILTLGTAFTLKVTDPPDALIQRGPYRWVRHPSYTGSLLTILGVTLCCANLVSLLMFILPIASYAYRIHVEEDVLKERMGDSYRAYTRRTKRLVPFLI